MDAFYASVELLRYPELKGRAVVVGGRRNDAPREDEHGVKHFARLADYVGRGVVTTSTYEARALGVFSGMGMMKAARLAPDAILLPADFDSYRHYSRRFKAEVARITPLIEDRGIDEIYIDLTNVGGDSAAIAMQLKQGVKDATGLTCSIGIAPNKLLAKICSELDKPDGITVLEPDDLPTRIWPLPARKINGIGPKAAAKLGELGITTIAQLAAAAPHDLIIHFGDSYGRWLHQTAHGIDERPVVTHSEPKSISRESTFERDLHPQHDRPALSAIFTHLCERVAGDLQRKGYRSRTVGIKLRFEDFSTITRDLSLPAPTDDATAIRRAAGECLKRIPLEKRIRLLGVRCGNLHTDKPLQQDEITADGQFTLAI